eukprot:2289172-Amphidinium_carterae.3
MAPKVVSKKPASRRKHGWSSLPVTGGGSSSHGRSHALQVWDYMDHWQEPGRGAHIAALLQMGHILEATVVSDGGRVLGHLMLHVVAVHPAVSPGVALEVEFCGVSNGRLLECASAAFTPTESPLVHVCAVKSGCRFGAGGRSVLHLQRWRLRNPLSIKEPPVPEETALLQRFEQMRDGVNPRPSAAEEDLGRQEVKAALREEEAAGRLHGSGQRDAGRVLLDRATVVATQGDEKLSKDKKKRKRSRRSSSSSSSDSESLALVDKHGVSQLAKVSERKPGYLAGETLKKMKEYLAVHDVGESLGCADTKWRPIVTSYLSTILLPSTEVTLRNSRELLTLARCADSLIRGEVARCLDVLLQRFQAIETSQIESSWSNARHLELVPESRVSCVPPKARRAATAAEKSDHKLRALLTSRGEIGTLSLRPGVAKTAEETQHEQAQGDATTSERCPGPEQRREGSRVPGQGAAGASEVQTEREIRKS